MSTHNKLSNLYPVHFAIEPFGAGFLGRAAPIDAQPVAGVAVAVYGRNTNAVTGYLQQLRTAFHPVPYRSRFFPPILPIGDAKPSPGLYEPGDQDLVIAFELPASVSKPRTVRFALDPPIGKNVVHDYLFCNATATATDLSMSKNRAHAQLSCLNPAALLQTTDADAGSNPSDNPQHLNSGTPRDPTCFCLRIVGQDEENTYALTGVYQGRAFAVATIADVVPCPPYTRN